MSIFIISDHIIMLRQNFSGGSRMGHLGQMPPPPPPSRNCIQDRDTLIEQSITLIKQSQCS